MITQENIPYTADEIKAMVKTIEELRKKYNNALERASKLRVQNPFDTVGQMVEHIFPELKNEDEKIRKEIVDFITSSNKYGTNERCEAWLAWLEGQGEEKPTDNVGPKFHKGDWIIHQGTENIYQVVAHIDNQYQLKYGDNYIVQNCADVDRCARLWTINDAKDGDLIYVSTGMKGIQAIFHKFENGIIYFHCNLCSDFMQGGYEPSGDVKSVNPLLKEHYQRFFQKMKEAGYEWDADKKELSKQTLKITPKFCVGQVITDDNGTWYKITDIKCLDDWRYELYDVGKASTHLELCSIIDERFRKNRFTGEIKKMMGD